MQCKDLIFLTYTCLVRLKLANEFISCKGGAGITHKHMQFVTEMLTG